MRRLGSYSVVYLVDGHGSYDDELGQEEELSPGDLIVLFPEIGHRYGPPHGKTWTEFFLFFEGPVFDVWRECGVLDPQQPVHHLQPVDHWLRRFESVLGGSRQAGINPPLLEVTRLQAVLADALFGAGKGPRQEEREWLANACTVLETYIGHELDLTEVSQRLNASYESFRKRFSRLAGESPYRYYTRRVIERACEMMQFGQMSDKQIAHALGFQDQAYFSRRFKHVTGESPSRFRASLPNTYKPRGE